jgi:putative SOS response-associated peptidase YedK
MRQIILPTVDLLFFAGLYESWHPQPGHWQRTFTIITTSANRLIQPIDDRMPAIVDERSVEDWMDPSERDPLRLKSLLVPAPDDNLVLSPDS